MARLFDTEDRIVPTWLAAARHLEGKPEYTDRNLLLEIANPIELTADDLRIVKAVNAALFEKNNERTVETVANTIFPQHLYRKHGRNGLYAAYQGVIARAGEGWGTYFGRMTNRLDRTGKVVNPLDAIVEKLKRSAQPGTATLQSAYELCASDPTDDVFDETGMGCELSTYDPGWDRKFVRGGPCLSHVSFKITGRTHVDLTAMYRSHFYCERALGNLVGLARLLRFAAKESGLEVGTLSCLSTHAVLDLAAWGGARMGRQLLSTLKLDQAASAQSNRQQDSRLLTG